MGRRIIGQVGISDFKGLAQLHPLLGGMLPRKLTKKEDDAVRVAYYFQQCGVPFSVLLKVKEVLLWEDEKGMLFEYKLLDPRDRETQSILLNMKVKEKR